MPSIPLAGEGTHSFSTPTDHAARGHRLGSITSRSDTLLWLLLAGGVSLAFAVGASWQALADPLVVHDDVRQHVFWVPRLHDPSLFPNDLIADYYQAQAPLGYQAVYWLATLGIDAITVSKLLPLLLTVLLAGAGFALGQSLWRRPDAAALGAVLIAWSAWQYDDVGSATPRAFAMPLLTAQLAALAAGRTSLALAVVVLTALLYPLVCPLMAITTGVWLLWRAGQVPTSSRAAATDGPTAPHRHRMPLADLLRLAGTCLIVLLIAGTQLRASDRFGPRVTLAESQQMSEFQPGGRSRYFGADPIDFWLDSVRSGLAFAPKDELLGELPALTIPLVLATVLGGWMLLGRFGLAPRPSIPERGLLLLVLIGSSLVLFTAAHVLLFALYLPARYVQFSLPIVWALAGALCWTQLGEQLSARFQGASQSLPAAFVIAGIGLLVLHAPPPGDFYVRGRQPALYAYLQTTPPDTLLATLPGDGSALPLFTRRPVLTSFEHALPYHLGYYGTLRARTSAIEDAYYAPTLTPLARLLENEGVGMVIANVQALDRRRRARPNQPPALATILDSCGALRERDLVAVPAECIRLAALERSQSTS